MRMAGKGAGWAAAVLAAMLLAACVNAAARGAAARPGGRGPDTGQSIPFDVPPGEPLRTGEHFVDLVVPEAYTPVPPRGGTDEYRCFLVDPGFTTSVFVTGSRFLPQNAQVVHHAIVFRVEPGDVEQAHRLDARDPGEGWTCFGGSGIGSAASSLRGNAAWIAAWAPGGNETLLDPRTGYRMEPGSHIVMQVHYNLLTTGAKATSDRSGIRLRVVDGGAGLRPLQTTLVAAPVELPCAAGETGDLCDRDRAIQDVSRRFGAPATLLVNGLNYLCNAGRPPVPGRTQHCDQAVRESGTVYSVAGHMHLLGRSVKVELNPGTAHARTLLDVPVYNFDDQGALVLPKPVRVNAGDVLRVTCTHDATLRRQLPELRPLPARYVVWGDGTSDEMCLGILIWSKDA
jgi:hypothetical protein